MDQALAELCTQTITLEAVASVDKTNKPTYAAAVNYAGYVQLKAQQVVVSPTLVVATKGVVFLVPIAGQAAPQDSARLTLPAGVYAVRQPPIVAVQPRIDEVGGVDHWVVYFN